MKLTKKLHRTAGFTLIEMLVVLVIIGLLASLVGPKLFGKLDSSKVQTAQTQVKMLKGALETMRLDLGRFPTQSEGLTLLNNPPTDEKIKNKWKGPYLDEDLPTDPWGAPYVYAVPGPAGKPFALYSRGPDGNLNGVGAIGIAPAADNADKPQ
ncbi:type II secretion system major pseudopilin GspG [Undibacterium terreum]|uniref:Type II secretion system core protein G n=1 Tax=Undibacterium terreum TaxID=1224302 RepID=A0A916XNS4_9BURK|nr:type II secretion system major pseudopilin GspG [Undibacterium terreum]GGC87441.1 type II secretion system protein GspG [Undibacterium terreum]